MAVKIINNSGSANFSPYIEYIKGEKGDKGDKGDKGEAGVIKFVPVTELPTENIEEDVIYLLPSNNPEEENVFNEYVYTNGAWEMMAQLVVEVNLDEYVKNTDYATNSKAGLVKLSGYYGVMSANSNELRGVVIPADEYDKKDSCLFISKGTLDNVTADYVKNTDYATKSKSGVVYIPNWSGIDTNSSGGIYLKPVTNDDIDNRDGYKALKAASIDYAVKVGLTANTETLTEEEKATACEWVGALVKATNDNTVYKQLYAINENNEQILLRATVPQGADKVAITDGYGCLFTAEPRKDNHAATKGYVDKAVGAYELIEEITVTEAGNVDKSTTPDGVKYSNLYKNMLVTIYNKEDKGCAYCYIYRVGNEICLTNTVANAGEFLVAKSEVIAPELSQWSAIKKGANEYGNNVIAGCVAASGNISRVLIAGTTAGTVIKIYGARA